MENYVIKDTEFLNELVNSSLKYTDISVYAAGIYNKSHSIEISICSHYAIITCTSKDSIVNLLIVKAALKGEFISH